MLHKKDNVLPPVITTLMTELRGSFRKLQLLSIQLFLTYKICACQEFKYEH